MEKGSGGGCAGLELVKMETRAGQGGPGRGVDGWPSGGECMQRAERGIGGVAGGRARPGGGWGGGDVGIESKSRLPALFSMAGASSRDGAKPERG